MENQSHFHRSLSLLDGALLVIGSMIGSGIFIVSADIARRVGSPGWLIAAWVITGFITLTAALSYGELSSMYPKAGGQYVYLREAFGKMFGFLYGWAFLAVIQTGTIAAVGVAFGKFLGYLVPAMGEENVLLGPINVTDSFQFSIHAAQLVGIGIIVLLTFINTFGVKTGKWIQFIFTFGKVGAMAALIIFGFMAFGDTTIWDGNWSTAWLAQEVSIDKITGTISKTGLDTGALVSALCVAMVGTIFSSDAWNNVTFIAGEIKKPERNIGLSLFIGTLVVTLLYVTMNFMYLNVLSMTEIAGAEKDRVALAAALKIFGGFGTTFIALMIMVSTFGCNNGLILSGARVYYTMSQDKLFFKKAGLLNKNGVPSWALWVQCVWACVLCLSGRYGDLLDYIVFTALLFYILTIAGVFKLRKTQPDIPRPYKAFGYPVIPALYIVMASFICIVLLYAKPVYTWPGLVIVVLGIPVYYYFQKKEAA